MKALAIAAAVAMIFAGNVNSARADFITINSTTGFYDTNWDNPGAHDHVTFGSSSVDISIALNTTITAVLESGVFENDYSFIPDQDFTFNVTQTLSVGAHSVLFTIPGMIRITGPGDTLFTYASDPVTLDLGNQTLLTIVANPITVPLYLGRAPFELTANFTLSPVSAVEQSTTVPLPSSLVMLSTLGMTGVGVGRFRRKRRFNSTVA